MSVRQDSVRLTYLADPPGTGGTPPRVSFALPRSAGSAVERNRCRRRAREIFRELERSGHLPAGTYLMGGGREVVTAGFDELREVLVAAVGRLDRRAGTGA